MTKHSGSQFLLRVRHGSELDNVMRSMMNNEVRTNEELAEIGGKARSGWLLRQLDQWFDNIGTHVVDSETKSVSMRFIDVASQFVPVSVGSDVKKADTHDDTEIVREAIRWPQAPPIIQKMENFRVPPYYKTMETMVNLGKHISLSGPPGVGKDTAVMQLAAEHSVPLVTVGGDAGFRKRDLVGTPQISNGHSHIDAAEYAAAVVNGWWVLLTEVNAADADALLFINTQLAAPNVINIAGQSFPVHKDFRLFITYNPGLIGTKPLPQSFKDRFFPIQIGFPTTNQLRKILESNGMPEDAKYADHLCSIGTQLWDAHERGQMRYQISTRRLIDVVVLLETSTCTNLYDAAKAAIAASIDSPVEQRAVMNVIGSNQDYKQDINQTVRINIQNSVLGGV